jgi:F-type H+-transporting ATPase subunit alpha
MKSAHAAWVDRIESTKDLSSEDEEALKQAILSFKKTGAF